jgi:hypothetical protein
MLDRESKRAASRRGVSSGMVVTGVVIKSAAVRASSGLAAFRGSVRGMGEHLQGE